MPKAVALIGDGSIAEFHRAGVEQEGSFDITDVAALPGADLEDHYPELFEDSTGTHRFCSETAGEEILASIEKRQSSGGDPVAVSVITPHFVHLEHAIRAIRSCHTLVEKPLAISVEEVRQLQQAASKAEGRVVDIAYHWARSPETQAAAQYIRANGLEVQKISGMMWGCSPGTDRGWFFKSEYSGGPTFDMFPNFMSAVHELDPRLRDQMDFQLEDASMRMRNPDNTLTEKDVEDSARLLFRLNPKTGQPVDIEFNVTWQEREKGTRPEYLATTVLEIKGGQRILVNHSDGMAYVQAAGSSEPGIALPGLEVLGYGDHETINYANVYRRFAALIGLSNGSEGEQLAMQGKVLNGAHQMLEIIEAAQKETRIGNGEFFNDRDISDSAEIRDLILPRTE